MSYATAASRWAGSLGGDEEGDGRRPGKGTCKAVWHEELAVFEVLQPRGDSLKSMVSTRRIIICQCIRKYNVIFFY